MNNNSIPSIKIKLLKLNYCTRPYYSSANPIIRLNKKIGNGETFIVLHHNIKINQDV
jgi:hypothetical protein